MQRHERKPNPLEVNWSRSASWQDLMTDSLRLFTLQETNFVGLAQSSGVA